MEGGRPEGRLGAVLSQCPCRRRVVLISHSLSPRRCVTDEGHTYYFSASRNASVWDAPRAAKTPSDKRTPRRWTPSSQKRPTPAAPRSPGTQLFAVPEAVTPSDDYESEAFDDYETPSK